jgi:hypothetical protein
MGVPTAYWMANPIQCPELRQSATTLRGRENRPDDWKLPWTVGGTANARLSVYPWVVQLGGCRAKEVKLGASDSWPVWEGVKNGRAAPRLFDRDRPPG